MTASSVTLGAAFAFAAIGFFIAQPLQLLPGERNHFRTMLAFIKPPINSTNFQIRIAADGRQRANSTVEVHCTPHAPGAIPGRSCSPALHVHADQAEYFETQKGAFGLHIDNEDRATLHPGDPPITVLAGVPHYFWNTKPDEEGILIAAFEGVGNVNMVFGDAIEIRTVATV